MPLTSISFQGNLIIEKPLKGISARALMGWVNREHK